jgi:hypothetical protein
MIPESELPEVFRAVGVALVDDARIPDALRRAGWSAEVWQKEVSDGVLVIQVIFGPGAGGQPVGRRRDVLQVHPDNTVEVHWSHCEHDDPCAELYAAIADA